jgi:hypothetical protein
MAGTLMLFHSEEAATTTDRHHAAAVAARPADHALQIEVADSGIAHNCNWAYNCWAED